MNLLPLQAGLLSVALQPEEGSIRYVHLGPHEVLRGIGAPIRDHVWTTIAPRIPDLAIEREADFFRVTFTATCEAHAIDFRWRGEIVGRADGTLSFDFDGEAHSDFHRNRMGFCVLHPAEAAGAACAVEHTDGRKRAGVFPREISPHQPFFDVRAITHEFAPGRRAEVRLEGDTFEMEDQRNWTDASFKTYCTPLALPRPVLITKGTRIRQRVTLRPLDSMGGAPPAFAFPWQPPSEVTLTIGEPLGTRLPKLGISWNGGAPSDRVVQALAPLQLAHLRVDLQLSDSEFPATFRNATAAAQRLRVPLETAVFVDDDFECQLLRLRAMLDAAPLRPAFARWLVFDETHEATPPALIIALRRVMAGSRCTAPVGGGATDNFTELNRHPAAATEADFTVHACNPQVHAFDRCAILETLPIQGVTVENARRLSGGRPAVVSPVTLTPRWRPGAAGGPPARPRGLMPFQTDPRQASSFAGAWTAGSISVLAAHGAESVTYFQTLGDNGILGDDARLLPVGEALRQFGRFGASEVRAARSSRPLEVIALALEHQGRRHLLVTNLSEKPQRVAIHGAWGARSLVVEAATPHVLEFGQASK